MAASVYRIQQDFYPGPDESAGKGGGLCDFFNGVYYPTRAFLAQDNPYTPQFTQQYPASRPVPPFSPLVFFVHLPFAWLPRLVSAWLYVVWLTVLTLALAAVVLRASYRQITVTTLFAVAAYVLFTRPGQTTMHNGYFNQLLAIGSILALHYGKTRPVVAALGLTLASCKPTFAIPLVILMLARRQWRATSIGVGLSAFFLLAGLGWLALDDSPVAVVAKFLQSSQAHGEFPNLWPVNTWARIDLLAVICKWIGCRPDGVVTLVTMLAILAVPCGCLFVLTGSSSSKQWDPGASGMLGLLCMLAMLLCVYHHFYDALMLLAPMSAMVLAPTSDWKRVSYFHRVVMACLISVPLLNYLSARAVLDRLDLRAGMPAHVWITSVNSVCLTVAAVYLMVLLWRQHACDRSGAVVRRLRA